MKKLQKHWRPILVVFLFVVLAGTFFWQGRLQTVVLAQEPPYEPLEDVERDAILAMLGEVALDRDALVALNLTGQQAESLLDSLRTWHANNANALAVLRATIAARTEMVRELRAAVAMGPRHEGRDQELATALQELANANAAYVSAVNGSRSGVDVVLSDSQRAAWAAIGQGLGQDMPIRLLSLSTPERLDLCRAWRHYTWQFGAASTPQDRDAALAAWETAKQTILSPDQLNVLAAYEGYYASSSQAVADALTMVLPPADGGEV